MRLQNGSDNNVNDTAFDVVNAGTGATNIIDPSQFAHDGNSNKTNTTATSSTAYSGWTTAMGTVTQQWFRGSFRIGALPSVERTIVRYLGSTLQRARLVWSSAGKFTLRDSANATVVTSTLTVVGAATWMWLEGHLDFNASGTYEMRFYTDLNSYVPVETLTGSAVNFGGSADDVRFGVGAGASNAVDGWVDDVAITDIGWLGPAAMSCPPPRILAAPVYITVPWQQRPLRSDPSLLSAPAVTDPTLTGVDRRYAAPVTNADRREAPAQRQYVSDPNLLGTAELENELLGGAGTAQRYLQPAAITQRVWMPRQPKRDGSAPGLLDSAELEGPLLGGDTRRHYAAASFVDRRQVPQQRRYVSDPSMLATALLENELLGSVDVVRRYRQPWARTTTPLQTPRLSDPRLLIPPAGTDPLGLAFGAGGDLWHRYNVRPRPRSWWPTLRPYATADPGCVTARPSTGITVYNRATTGRPGTGTTTRPTTGTTTRPNTGITHDPC